jgi:hypothetical protein
LKLTQFAHQVSCHQASGEDPSTGELSFALPCLASSSLLTPNAQDKGHAAVAVTSPTGVSAIGIDGVTLHSFAGCGVPRTAKDFGTMFNKENYAKWMKLRVLVVDEISMVQVSPPLLWVGAQLLRLS